MFKYVLLLILFAQFAIPVTGQKVMEFYSPSMSAYVETLAPDVFIAHDNITPSYGYNISHAPEPEPGPIFVPMSFNITFPTG